MSNSLTKLREAIAAERKPKEPAERTSDTGGKVIDLMIALKNSLAPQTTDAALAAVEQEMAALQAERDELRKRPTLQEAKEAMIGAKVGDVLPRLEALYARQQRSHASA